MDTRSDSDWHKRYARMMLASDVVILVWVFLTAHIAWAVSLGPVDPTQESPYDWGPILASVVLVGVWLIALAMAGTRDPIVLGAGPDEYKRILVASVMWFAVVAFAGFMTKSQVPRSYVLVAVAFGVLLLVLNRWAWRQWLVMRRQRGEMSSRTLIVGTERAVERIINVVGTTSHFGYKLVGVCVPAASQPRTVLGLPVLGDLDQVVAVVDKNQVDAVLVGSTDATHSDMVQQLGWDLEPFDVEIIVAPSLANIAGPRVHVRPVAGLPLLHVEAPSYRGTARWVKGIFDRAGSLALILVGSPIFLVTALVIKLTSRGPVFFRQERVGLDGHNFGMIKFRSMVVDAEERLADLQADSGNEVMFKMRDDPRVTKIGKLIRRTSIDELPQLFNVLKGDMSLVGPRPPLVSEVSGYANVARRRLLVRPGITGLWQVSGRSNLDWEETVRLDLYYVENWSLVGDLVILWRTLRAVVSSEGAY